MATLFPRSLARKYMRLFDMSDITGFIKEYRSWSIYKAIDIPFFATAGIVISHDLIKGDALCHTMKNVGIHYIARSFKKTQYID